LNNSNFVLFLKDGRVAADYAELRETKEIKQMLYDARTLDLFGKVMLFLILYQSTWKLTKTNFHQFALLFVDLV
jgi:hypothetical protein